MDLTASAYMLITCKSGSEERVVEKISRLSKDIKEVRVVSGNYDIIAKIESNNELALNSVIAMIRRVDEVYSSLTMKVMEGFGGKG